MPESKKRTTGKNRVESSRREQREAERVSQEFDDVEPLPTWYKVIMFGLLILGLLWIIVWYLSNQALPIAGIGGWNIVIGFSIAIVGFLMMTRWR